MIQATIAVKYILRQTTARAKELWKCTKVLSLVLLNSSNSKQLWDFTSHPKFIIVLYCLQTGIWPGCLQSLCIVASRIWGLSSLIVEDNTTQRSKSTSQRNVNQKEQRKSAKLFKSCMLHLVNTHTHTQVLGDGAVIKQPLFFFFATNTQELQVNSRECRMLTGGDSPLSLLISHQNLGCRRRSNPGNPWQRSRRFSSGKTLAGRRAARWWWRGWCGPGAARRQWESKMRGRFYEHTLRCINMFVRASDLI